MTNEMTITKTLFLKASPERVWRFLTKKELLATWFMAGGRMSSQVATGSPSPIQRVRKVSRSAPAR